MKHYKYDEGWGVLMIILFALVIMAATLYTHADGQGLEDGYYNLEDLSAAKDHGDLQPPYLQGLPAPRILPLECGIERETPLSSYMGVYNSSDGVEVYKYDTNNDGWGDVQIRLHSEDRNRYPEHYGFDRDYAIHTDDQGNEYTTPEIIYVDTLRDGTCRGIQIFWTPQIEDHYNELEKNALESDCVRGDCTTRQEADL